MPKPKKTLTNILRGGSGAGAKAGVIGLKECQANFRDLIGELEGTEQQQAMTSMWKVLGTAAELGRQRLIQSARSMIPGSSESKSRKGYVSGTDRVVKSLFTYAHPPPGRSKRPVSALLGLTKKGRGGHVAPAYVEWGYSTVESYRRINPNLARFKYRGGRSVDSSSGLRGMSLGTMAEIGTKRFPKRPWFVTAIKGMQSAIRSVVMIGVERIVTDYNRD